LVFGITLSLPTVQTKIARYITQSLHEDFGVKISIDKAAITIYGGVKLKNVLILDHHNDTLIYANRIKTNILDGKKILNGDLIFGGIRLDGLIFNLKTYKNEKETNLDKFIAAFDTGTPPSDKHFLLKAKKVYITNGRFILTDENRENPKDIDFTKLNTLVSDFLIYGPKVDAVIERMSFLDHRGIFVTNLSSTFSYTEKSMKLENFNLSTAESKIKGYVALNYKIDDFSQFTDKVRFDVKLQTSLVATNDIRHFYKELGKNQRFYIKARIKGPLNNLNITRLKLVGSRNSRILGAINFKNLFGNENQKFYMNGKFAKLSSSYDNLVTLLPNVLGKKLPVSLKKLGFFNIVGSSQVTTTSVDASFHMKTALGNVQSDLEMKNIDRDDKVSYLGNVILENFDIGAFLDNKKVGKVTMNIDVDGKGFSEKYLNTAVKGDVSQIYYNNYTYNKISLNGNFKMPYYKGQISVDDPNLNMNFDGLVDLSKKDSRYDFNINVYKVDLHKLNFVKDSISQFKGTIIAQATGNTIENLQGKINFQGTTYQNTKATYVLEDFEMNSSFDENRIRTIDFNSMDIVTGQIIGKFRFDQLKSLITNSLGSLYTNYKPLKVNKGQFLKFDFTIHNKIVEMFFPEISISSNTVLKGNINSDNQDFKFNFNSPIIKASKNTFDNIRIAIDNKNPLYNAYIELDSIKTEKYKIRDFSLINVTMKDTLFFRSEFKGGENGEDYYNLNLYHTINKDNKNVVGISKSEIKFKDYLWYLNEKEGTDNKIVFDKLLKNFNIDNIVMSHENQEVALIGDLNDTSFKDLKLSFKDVDLNKITPTNNKFIFHGNLNGEVNFKQNRNVYQPSSSLKIDHLILNKKELGDFNLDIEGDENLEKFTINSVIENENMESFKAYGDFEIKNKETILNLKLSLDKFNLATLDPLGGNVISNIRGDVSGNASIEGNLKKPEINGRLYVSNAGMTIPYLNTDYSLSEKTIVDLTGEKFLFRNNTLTDTKYKTKGTLNGVVEHNNFADWKLDLRIDTKRILVLDTKDSEDAAYFGTAFINGRATIKGPTNALFIKLAAKSEKGTAVKIPINNAESLSENDFIHFLTAKEKYNLKKGIVEHIRNYNGLELEFDFDITPDAEVEVILDRSTGHGMKGKGFGSLLFKINTLGKFNMWGDFQAYEGTYNFKYRGLIDKKFNVKKGGSITWEGNPMKARLNLEAVYKTTANPAVMLENSSFNKKVDTEVIIGLHGDLTNLDPNFEIRFPTVSNVMKSEVEYKLSDKDVRQTQALYLLSTGSFLSPEGVNQSDLSGSLFETASSFLGSFIEDDSNKFNVGVNFVSADKRPGREADGRFEATFSSQLNERFSINGKVGVPFGGVNQSTIVGDVEMKYRVNDDGTFNLRMFNRENDINYIGEGIGYTQGLGVSYEVDFDTFKEFINKIFKNHKLEPENKTPLDEGDHDSNIKPEDINFSNPKRPNLEIPKVNQEALAPEED